MRNPSHYDGPPPDAESEGRMSATDKAVLASLAMAFVLSIVAAFIWL